MPRRPDLSASPVVDSCVSRRAVSIVIVSTMVGLSSGCGGRTGPQQQTPSTPGVDNHSGPAAVDSPTTAASQPELIVASEALRPARDDPEPVAVPAGESSPVFRPDDLRPQHDDTRAADLGIHRYESTRLRLYTDIDADLARTLPPLMDEAYRALVEYFGPLPPARNGGEYQMTGYIMADQDRFREAGMLPQQASDLLVHGIHRGSEFWINSQEYDYYRRHLMVHEGTHCFMTVLNGPRPPAWYMEGMAEFFGTHRVEADGHATFGVMPDDPANFVGFGRVEMLREELAAGNFRSVDQVLALTGNDFIASRREPYAWSWAFCKFANAHPRYQARFRELIQWQYDPRFASKTRELLAPVSEPLAIEWELFVRNLVYGYDIERAAIEFRRGSPLSSSDVAIFDLRADAGWQSSGIWLDAGTTWQIAAAGEVTLELEPKPWISQPQGVSIRYAGGRPVGRVVAAILSEPPADSGNEGNLWQVIDIGRGRDLTPTVSGTLYFRVNDDWNSLNRNAGAYQVQVSRR